MPNLGTLYVVSAPSGAGKTSLIAALVAETSAIMIAISYTTRAKRSSEQNNVNYHFVSQQTFATMQQNGDFLEHAEVFGNNYGTSRLWVEQQLAQGQDVIVEIDWQGKQQIAARVKHFVSIFILPPSQAVLQQRLEARAEDDVKIIKQRMQQAKAEITHYNEYQYLVLNDNFATAVADLKAIMHCNRLQRLRQIAAKPLLLPSLLG